MCAIFLQSSVFPNSRPKEFSFQNENLHFLHGCLLSRGKSEKTKMKIALVIPRNSSDSQRSFYDYKFGATFLLSRKHISYLLAIPTLTSLTPPQHEIRVFDENIEDIDYDLAGRPCGNHGKDDVCQESLCDIRNLPGERSQNGLGRYTSFNVSRRCSSAL